MRRKFAILLIGLFLIVPSGASAYSVLAHEAIIDVTWESQFRPLLLRRFPQATADELRIAHGYAYGGAIIQDLGYYPGGRRFYTDLVHYVRSGDFILTLIRDSHDLNEYAFALGALSHYAADSQGHRIAVNLAVPILYPKLKKKFSSSELTYEDDPAAHLKTEFSFDVLEIAKGRFAPNSYHDFIGFFVAKDLLERAFEDTYSIPLRSVFDNLDDAVGNYRHTVSTTIPRATRIAWALKKDDIQKDSPGIARQKFLYNLSRASYEKEWGTNYKKPGFTSKFLALVVRILPKIGPLNALTFRTPTPEVEKMFMASFNAGVEQYKSLLAQVGSGNLTLPNINFDTGAATSPGIYFMQADAYAELLDRLSQQQFQGISPALRSDVLNFFQGLASDRKAPAGEGQKTDVDWRKVPPEVESLKTTLSQTAVDAEAREPNISAAPPAAP